MEPELRSKLQSLMEWQGSHHNGVSDNSESKVEKNQQIVQTQGTGSIM